MTKQAFKIIPIFGFVALMPLFSHAYSGRIISANKITGSILRVQYFMNQTVAGQGGCYVELSKQPYGEYASPTQSPSGVSDCVYGEHTNDLDISSIADDVPSLYRYLTLCGNDQCGFSLTQNQEQQFSPVFDMHSTFLQTGGAEARDLINILSPIFTDLWPLLALLIGITLAFYVIDLVVTWGYKE